jgi:hypothetical protein
MTPRLQKAGPCPINNFRKHGMTCTFCTGIHTSANFLAFNEGGQWALNTINKSTSNREGNYKHSSYMKSAV